MSKKHRFPIIKFLFSKERNTTEVDLEKFQSTLLSDTTASTVLEETLKSSFRGDRATKNKTDTDPSDENDRHRVSFGSVEVREYARIVGDNPFVVNGPPLAISSAHTAGVLSSLNQYELDHERSSSSPRMERLSAEQRTLVLRNAGMPLCEIRSAERRFKAKLIKEELAYEKDKKKKVVKKESAKRQK